MLYNTNCFIVIIQMKIELHPAFTGSKFELRVGAKSNCAKPMIAFKYF